jgi:hypothetical protein
MEGATGSCPRDFLAAEDARQAKERQRTMKIERSPRTGSYQLIETINKPTNMMTHPQLFLLNLIKKAGVGPHF